jgi:hypothetical protein
MVSKNKNRWKYASTCKHQVIICITSLTVDASTAAVIDSMLTSSDSNDITAAPDPESTFIAKSTFVTVSLENNIFELLI